MEELISSRPGQLFLVASAIGMAIWARALARSGGPRQAVQWLCPARDRVCPFWSPLDAFFLFLGYVFATGMVVFALTRLKLTAMPRTPATPFYEFDVPGDPVAVAVATIVGGVAAVLFATVLMRLRDPSALAALGWRWRGADLWLGLKWAFLVLPAVLVVAELASRNVAEYEHDVLEGLLTLQGPAAISMVYLSTALITPIVEEFFFRGLMLGALEYVDSFRRGGPVAGSGPNEGATALGNQAWRPASIWPLVFSSALFALAHWGQGAAWIPLFFFAMALGWLYRQTGSLVAPIVLHAILNASTLTLYLWMSPNA